MSLRHPSREILHRWLTEDDDDPRVDDHLRTCDRCAAVVEELADADEAGLGEPLAIALAPPPDLADRLESRVAAKLSSREVLNVVADLFGAGLETTRLLFTEDDHDEH